MEDNVGCGCLLFVVVLVVGIAFYGAVWNSDLPMWLKWFLLK